MKFQRSTIILLFGALLMGGAFYYYQTLFIPAQEAKEAFARKLFKFKEEDVQAIFVKTQSQTLRFERASDLSTPQDLWLMQILEVAEAKEEKPSPKATPKPSANPEETAAETPTETGTPEETAAEITAETTEETVNAEETAATENSQSPAKIPEKSTETSQEISQEKVYANEAYVSFLLEQLVSDRSQQTLTATPAQIKEYGLNPPVAIIEVILKNQKIYQMILGKSEFSGNAIYAQVNPPLPETENQTVLVVSQNFEYAVDRTLEDWKQPAAVLEENPATTPESPAKLNPEQTPETLPPSNETENPAPENNPEPETLEPTPEPAEPNPETTEPVNPESLP